MATFASPQDAALLEAIYHWKRVAIEAVDCIGSWREASCDQASFRWPDDDPDFTTNTRRLASTLQAHAGIDPAPIVKLHQVVSAWRWARSAAGLPLQGALALLLHEAVDLLRPLETDVLFRAGSLPASALAGLQPGAGSGPVAESTAPVIGGDAKLQAKAGPVAKPQDAAGSGDRNSPGGAVIIQAASGRRAENPAPASAAVNSSDGAAENKDDLPELQVDFFVSYTCADQHWAEWIAWHLEQAGYRTLIQAWDFRPGANFVQSMQDAAGKAQRTVAVLSPDYLQSQFTKPEWYAAFAQDPTGEKGTLLPVRIAECELTGLLPQIVYIDLVGLNEDEAKRRLLAGVNRSRAKPTRAPSFPGTQPSAPSFPDT